MVSAATLVDLLGSWAEGGDPLNEQLASALARAIDLGVLPPGTRLPAERELARELALSRTTIVAAYDRLRLAGLARSRQGSGTRVAARRPGLTQSYLAPLDGVDSDAVVLAPASTAPAVGLLTPLVDDAIELTIGALPAGSIVAEAMTAAVRDDLPALMLDSGYDPFGLSALRDQIAAYLTRLGVRTEPDQILVTSGAQQALHLIGSQLGGPGSAVVMENPSYIGAIDAFRTTGNRLIPIPVDEDGGRVEVIGLLGTSAPVRLVYVIPTFHNPTGTVMPETRRRELARMAGEAGFLVVEDLTPDLTLGVDSPLPVAAFDPGEQVITVGSLSKLAWGGLRVGWVRASRAIIDRLVAGKIVADHSSSLVTQAIGARVFERLDEVAARSRQAGAERRAVLMSALADRLPEWTWTEPRGGLSLWVRLPGADAVAFSRLAATLGVVVRPGPLASPDGGFRDHIRIAYGSEPDRLADGVERLAAAWAAYTPVSRQSRPSLAVSV
ncbi:MAG TPA: PLP-dependent aminotransferase family protein [Methylomirabilota bacterium]|nr:PLP-dependent aminotransferase family protein [Methylomirabilota bacterium]